MGGESASFYESQTGFAPAHAPGLAEGPTRSAGAVSRQSFDVASGTVDRLVSPAREVHL